MRFSPALFLLLANAALLPSAALAGDPKFSTPEAASQYHVMVGELAALRHEPELAAQEFMKALDVAGTPDLAMRAASLALLAKDEPLALKAAKRWQQLAPNDMDPREAVARLALRAGDRAEVRTQCEAIVSGHPGGPDEGFHQIAQMLAQEGGKKEDALAVMDQLRDTHALNAGAWYAQSLLALRFNELPLAESSVREALKLKPGARDSLLLLTGVLVKKGDIAAADATMGELFKKGDDPDLRMGYARLLLEADQQDAARKQFEAALAKKPDSVEARYALGLLALEQQRTDEAEPYFKALLTSEELKDRAEYYLGRIEETRNHPQKALEWYEKVSDGEQALDALSRRAAVLAKLGRLGEGRTLLQDSRRQLPMFATRFYLAEGELLLDSNNEKEALALYETALKESPDDSDLLYGRSLVHEKLSNVDGAEADLRKILEKDKDDARAMNALGYMLTVHTTRFGEARKLISRALELTPDDAAVIDSMGWIDYREGKMQEALVLLQKAFDKAHDPEIAAHLGEVLWTLGNKGQARAVWDSALAKDPGHRVLKETMERLAR